MARNVEIKAEVADPADLRERAIAHVGVQPTVILQTDTFFATGRERLKLRRFADGSGELIHYERTDAEGPKTSRYLLCPIPDADALLATLSPTLPVLAVVRKRRELLLAGRTRIHLDDVEGLGHFMELEVVLDGDEDIADGEAEAHALMEVLGVQAGDLVAGAYVDLLAGSGPARD